MSRRLEAIARSVPEYYSLSSSGTNLGDCQPLSSSRSPGIAHPQPVMATTCMSSLSRVLVDRPSQFPFSTHDSINYDTVILLPSPLGVSATPTLSLSSSLATNSRTTSRVMAIRRGGDSTKDKSPETTSSSDAASSFTTPTPDDEGGNGGSGSGNGNGNGNGVTKGNSATVKTKDSETPPGHASTTTTPDTYAWTATVTPFSMSSQQDATSLLTTAIARCAPEIRVDR